MQVSGSNLGKWLWFVCGSPLFYVWGGINFLTYLCDMTSKFEFVPACNTVCCLAEILVRLYWNTEKNKLCSWNFRCNNFPTPLTFHSNMQHGVDKLVCKRRGATITWNDSWSWSWARQQQQQQAGSKQNIELADVIHEWGQNVSVSVSVTTRIYYSLQHEFPYFHISQLEFIFIWTTNPIMGSCYNINSYIFRLPNPNLGSCYNLNLD